MIVQVTKPKDSIQWNMGLGQPPSKHKNARVKVQNDIHMSIHAYINNIPNSQFHTTVQCTSLANYQYSGVLYHIQQVSQSNFKISLLCYLSRHFTNLHNQWRGRKKWSLIPYKLVLCLSTNGREPVHKRSTAKEFISPI